MIRSFACLALLLVGISPVLADSNANDADGFVPIFDGSSLDGWTPSEERPEGKGFWRVEDGAIVGQSTEANPVKQNTFLVFDEPVGDFELTFEVKLMGTDRANTGVQYRSKLSEKVPGRVEGYQADLDNSGRYTGILYDEMGRGILADKGQTVTVKHITVEEQRAQRAAGQKMQRAKIDVASVDDVDPFKKDEWNSYKVIARGNRFQHLVNGVKTADVTDEDEPNFEAEGLIALQLHQGPPMQVAFRDMKLKRLGNETAAVEATDGAADKAADDVVTYATGFRSIMPPPGTLDGWSSPDGFWRNEDGAIVAESTPENPCKTNSFLTWDLGELDDFELKLQFKIEGSETANSGVQYRAQRQADGHIAGYQADITGPSWGGQHSNLLGALYDERGRKLLAGRGQSAIVHEGMAPKTRPLDGGAAPFNAGGWNDYRIVARGNRLRHFVNGVLTADVTDNDIANRDLSGLLALQLHSGPPMKVSFLDIHLKRLPLSQDRRKVVFIGGKPSHGIGAHEFNAGSMLLADAIDNGMEDFVTTVYTSGWPEDPTALDNADVIVCGFNGGKGSPLMAHAEQVDRALERGCGFVAWHYAVEVPTEFGDTMLDWLGGYFETYYSVNPWWTNENSILAEDHPITSGVQPFAVRDEWYYHMRFPDDMRGVTPILSALPPRETVDKPDGHHSSNPHVREAVMEREEPQVLAWTYERPLAAHKRGFRSFGFTGGHTHANWQNDDFRTLFLNAVVWAAGAEVPSLGVPSSTPTDAQIAANQDVQPERKSKRNPKQAAKPAASTEAVFVSPLVTEATPGHAVEIEADLGTADELYLVVTDGGDGYSFDWANWVGPRIESAGKSVPLDQFPLVDSTAGWGKTQLNANAAGKPMKVAGQPIETGIGTHSPSVIRFDISELDGPAVLKATGAIDDGGASQAGDSSIRFAVFTQPPSDEAIAMLDGDAASGDIRAAENAVAGLDTVKGLETQLIASEPMLYSPANIDVDHLGRIWVAEIVNYRHFRNTENPPRKEGDRILVLQDTTGDGLMDAKTTFYQSPDIDSPHGVCVLPEPDGSTRVIVSAGEHVYNLYDDDGDLKADRREVMFSGIGGVQHDHGIHSFVFGPDGKLYFNFGNEGKQLKDKDGNIVIDLRGEEIVEDMKPYQMGMVFRCDLDGSNVETLGWNFRNNWELAVDSYGSIWQSDNDDDGNRGTRLNFVMEYGNYGYRDEITGAGWREPRTGWEDTVPERHWHLNDPGVVPNLIQTGAGSPTGIMVYEGDLLPEEYRGQIIHCDAGPNMVRAFMTQPDGAGYSAEMKAMITGSRDQWFRPSDVCCAPDGSLIVADWYDPGVGGHRQKDVMRGRLFRLAPPDSKWSVPAIDVTTPQGAVDALMSPNLAARYLGWRALAAMQRDAKKSTEKNDAFRVVFKDLQTEPNPIKAARLLHAFAGLNPNRAVTTAAAGLAFNRDEPELRVVSVRIARSFLDDEAVDNVLRSGFLSRYATDESPAVRRAACIALAELPDDVAALHWPTLAMQYDGQDRWYLEALGIAARGRWDRCLDALMNDMGVEVMLDESAPSDATSSDAGASRTVVNRTDGDVILRDIIWRSRGRKTPALLAKLIRDKSTPAADLPRLMRSFDFQTASDAKNDALADLAFGPDIGRDDATNGMIRTEALDRVESVDFKANPEYRDQLQTVLDANRGTDGYVRLVRKFWLEDRGEQLLGDILKAPTTEFAANGIKLLASMKQWPLLRKAAADPQRVSPLIRAMRRSAASQVAGLLTDIMDDESQPITVRREAVAALARSTRGAETILDRKENRTLDRALVGAAKGAMGEVSHWGLRDRIAKLFPPPAGKDGQATPPISELVGMQGDLRRGRLAFNSVGTCAKCHVVDGIGKEVGPNLSEIGTKLSREAMFTAILYPSAGISHNYETFSILTEDGDVVTGLMVSETEEAVTLRDINANNVTVERDRIEAMKRQDLSLMPADLQKILSTQELVDVVDYMQSLKKKM